MFGIRRPNHADERAAVALDFQVISERNSDLRDLQTVASALRPAIHPGEDYRAALKERVLREFAKPDSDLEDDLDAGSHDTTMTAHAAVQVVTEDGGRIVLADVENLTPERAKDAAMAVESIIAASRATTR